MRCAVLGGGMRSHTVRESAHRGMSGRQAQASASTWNVEERIVSVEPDEDIMRA